MQYFRKQKYAVSSIQYLSTGALFLLVLYSNYIFLSHSVLGELFLRCAGGAFLGGTHKYPCCERNKNGHDGFTGEEKPHLDERKECACPSGMHLTLNLAAGATEFLTGCWPGPVRGPGVWNPWPRPIAFFLFSFNMVSRCFSSHKIVIMATYDTDILLGNMSRMVLLCSCTAGSLP